MDKTFVEKTLFSIITITFNSEKTIERTLKSVLAQSYTDYEYIIVDGASKDSTMDIVRKYEPLFEGRMKWKSEPDKGIYDAMNKGIERSTGVIVGIVNSDDWLEADALENVQKAFIENKKCENSLYCGGINFVTKNKTIRKPSNLALFYKNTKFYLMAGIRHPATFVPKQVYDKLGCFDSRMKITADRDFILRCYFNGIKFVGLDYFLSNMSDGGVSTSISKNTLIKAIDDRKLMLKNFEKKGAEFYYLYYYWRFRNIIADFVKTLGLYK